MKMTQIVEHKEQKTMSDTQSKCSQMHILMKWMSHWSQCELMDPVFGWINNQRELKSLLKCQTKNKRKRENENTCLDEWLFFITNTWQSHQHLLVLCWFKVTSWSCLIRHTITNKWLHWIQHRTRLTNHFRFRHIDEILLHIRQKPLCQQIKW